MRRQGHGLEWQAHDVFPVTRGKVTSFELAIICSRMVSSSVGRRILKPCLDHIRAWGWVEISGRGLVAAPKRPPKPRIRDVGSDADGLLGRAPLRMESRCRRSAAAGAVCGFKGRGVQILGSGGSGPKDGDAPLRGQKIFHIQGLQRCA